MSKLIYLLTYIHMLSKIHLVLELAFCNTTPREREFSTHIMHLYTSTNPILIQPGEKERGLEGEQTYLQIPICNLEDTSRRYGGNNFPHKIILLKGNYSCFDDNKSRKFLLLFLYYTFLYFFFLDFFFFFVIGSPVSSLLLSP